MITKLNASKNKSKIVLFGLLAFVIVYFMYNLRRVLALAPDFVLAFCTTAVVLSVAVAVSFWLIFKKQKNFVYILVAWVIGLSVFYLVIFPPFTVPDEVTHYLTSYRISNYFLFNFSQASNEMVIIRDCDREFILKLDRFISADYIKSFYSSFSVFADNTAKAEVVADNAATNVPFGYIFSGFGIAIARLFKLSPFFTFVFGRCANIAAFTAMLVFAIKRMPIGKLVIASVSLLPIVLHLAASFSYDAITIAYAFCFIAQVMHIKKQDTVASKKDIALLLLFSILLAPSKLVYLPVVFVLLIIPTERFGLTPKKANVIKYGCLLITLVVFLLLQTPNFIGTVNDTETGLGAEPAYSLSWILANPLESLNILIDTFKEFGLNYVYQMFSRTLSWLNVELPLTICVAFAIIIFASFIKRKDETFTVDFTQKAWILLCVIGSALLVMLSMFIAVTPNNCPVILGVQGRYFIPLFFPLYLVLRNKFVIANKNIDKYLAVALVAISAVAASEVFTIIISPIA